jgi:ribA/ribD-fused uncharacterized protein
MIIHPDKSRHPTVTETGIYGFFDEFRWLSNFHPCEIEFEGLIYPSTENAYQAAKTYDQNVRIALTKCTPYQSKKISHSYPIERDNWDYVRVGIMAILQMKKYAIPELQRKLLMTDGYYLEETNNWGDKFWGVVDHDGKNMLGHTIMITRSHYKVIV